MNVEALLNRGSGSVQAPAGCGKTHLIMDLLTLETDKPTLVLTHTTAGVASLSKRLRDNRVPSDRYIVRTIDAWCIYLAKSFPRSCPVTINPGNPSAFYPALRSTVLSYLSSGALDEPIKSSYTRIIVDEYQDCIEAQHQLFIYLKSVLDVIVLGDPMQSIFSFAGRIPDWVQEVEAEFPVLGTLTTPWRWVNQDNSSLGDWVLKARTDLEQGRGVDLRQAPDSVVWVKPVDGESPNVTKLGMPNRIAKNYPNDSILVIGSSTNAGVRYEYARLHPFVQAIEPVDLLATAHLISKIANSEGASTVHELLRSLSFVMTGVRPKETLKRIESIKSGRAKKPATTFEQALCDMGDTNEPAAILNVIRASRSIDGSRCFRPTAFNVIEEVYSRMAQQGLNWGNAFAQVREENRARGDRRIFRRSIGSTLLVKGLEADHVVILETLLSTNGAIANAKNLYVALTRGAKTVTVFSENPVIT